MKKVTTPTTDELLAVAVGVSTTADMIRTRMSVPDALLAPEDFARLHQEISAALGEYVSQGNLGDVLGRGHSRISNYENKDAPPGKQAKKDVSVLMRYVHHDITKEPMRRLLLIQNLAARIGFIISKSSMRTDLTDAQIKPMVNTIAGLASFQPIPAEAEVSP